MYWRPITRDVQRFAVRRQLALGAGEEQVVVAGWRCTPSGLELGGFSIEDSLANVITASAQQDHRRRRRPAELQAGVAADLRRHRALALAELDQRVAERALDREEDDQRDHQRDLVEVLISLALGDAPDWRREEREQCGERGPRRRGFYSGLDGTRLMTNATRIGEGGERRRRQRLVEPPAAQRPLKRGARLCANAVAPSTKSALPADSCWMLGLQLELLVHARVQPVVQLALGARVGAASGRSPGAPPARPSRRPAARRQPRG